MAKVDIVHDEHGNVHSFAVHSPDKNLKTGTKLQEGQKVSTVEIPHELATNQEAFRKAVHHYAHQQAAKG